MSLSREFSFSSINITILSIPAAQPTPVISLPPKLCTNPSYLPPAKRAKSKQANVDEKAAKERKLNEEAEAKAKEAEAKAKEKS